MTGLSTARLPLSRRALPVTGHVELWLTNLADIPLLEEPASGGHRQQQQALKVRQRFFLRLLLGSYLGCPGKEIRFEFGVNGKPCLAEGLATGGAQFNLSHSGNWLAVAVARDLAVGVDIECRRELPRAEPLARRFLSSAEACAVAGQTDPARSERFLSLWCRREALVKAMGASVVANLGRIALDPIGGHALSLPAEWPDAAEWTLLEPALPPELIGALAVPSTGQIVRTLVLECREPG